jgi:hypothetical protein
MLGAAMPLTWPDMDDGSPLEVGTPEVVGDGWCVGEGCGCAYDGKEDCCGVEDEA